MGSILDVTLKPYVQRNLNARQSLLSQEVRDPRFHQYVSAKNSWVRMTSLVNYDPADGSYKGDQLSRKYVLEGGTLFQNPDNPDQFSLRRGVSNKAGSYGALGDRSFGIRPMPGIVSVDLKNRGALGSTKEAVVKFMAWDKGQLDELEILFQRPGYSVLLEFGWSIYLDTYYNDNTSISSNVIDQLPLSQVKIKNFIEPTINAFDPTLIPPDLYKRFEILRQKHSGNYEGMVGKIRNFSYTQLSNGGFECTTTIIAISDVLDTLKINSSTYPLGTTNQDNSQKSNKRLLTRFEQIFIPFIDLSPTDYRNYLLNNVMGKNITKYQKDPAKGDFDPNIDFGIYVLPFKSVPSTLITQGVKNINGELHYMSMGAFIAVMNTQFGLYDPRKSNNIPLIELEVPHPEYGTYGNGICVCSEDTISIDPTICLVNNPNAKFVVDGINGFVPNVSHNNKNLVSFNPFPYQSSKNIGVISNIYLCIEYLMNRFRDMSTNSDGTVDMHKFIQSILDDVSYSLGSVNQLGFYADDSTAAIIDAHFIEDPTQSKRTRFTFNYIGNNSTVRHFDINAKIFESQATMVAIGAGVRANIAGVQTSTFNLLNKGLTDRLVLQTLDVDAINSLSANQVSGSSEDQDKAYREQLGQMVLDLRTYVQSYLQNGDLSQVLGNKQAANSNLNSVIVKINTDTNFKALIPISVELTVDGISGMVIGNVFRLNKDSLPKDYVTKDVAFRIVGLSHHIANSDWTTTIVAQCCLLRADQKQSFNVIDKNGVNATISGLQAAQQQQANLNLQKQIYIYNELIRLIISIFAPNNREALDTLNGLLNNSNLFQPNTPKTSPFLYNFDRDGNTVTKVTHVFYPGYPINVINTIVTNANLTIGTVFKNIAINNMFDARLTTNWGLQWILNPYTLNQTAGFTAVNTIVQSAPDYNSINNETIFNTIVQVLVDIEDGMKGEGGSQSVNKGIVKLPLLYIPAGSNVPLLNQNIIINVNIEATKDFDF